MLAVVTCSENAHLDGLSCKPLQVAWHAFELTHLTEP